MRSPYGYAPRGQRCYESAPFRVGRRLGLIGWIGARDGRVVPLEGSVTAEVFEEVVQRYLVPWLEPNEIVVWDNARIHSERAVQLVRDAKADVLAQPRYSPETNAAEPARHGGAVLVEAEAGGVAGQGGHLRSAIGGARSGRSERDGVGRGRVGAALWLWPSDHVSTAIFPSDVRANPSGPDERPKAKIRRKMPDSL